MSMFSTIISISLLHPSVIWEGITHIPYMYEKSGIGPVLVLANVILIDLLLVLVTLLCLMYGTRFFARNFLRKFMPKGEELGRAKTTAAFMRRSAR